MITMQQLEKYVEQFLETEQDCTGTDEEGPVPVSVQREVLESFLEQLGCYLEAEG
jgi:hypothetical protein